MVTELTEKKLKESIEEIIERNGANTSEGAIYWNSGYLEICVNEIYELIKKEINKND
jgi:hypothetical protein